MEFVKYTTKRGRKNKEEYQKAVEKGVEKFKKRLNNKITTVISDKEPRNNDCDIEASYLCHGVWNKLLRNEEIGSGNYFCWANNSYNSEIIFHFDIMNNPCKTNNNIYSCGLFKDQGEKDRIEFEKMYHCIGNIALMPWFETNNSNYINGQMLHKALDERWDLYLSVLRNNWSDWNKFSEDFTFEEYMKISLQQVYYKDVYEMAIKKKIGEISKDDIENWNVMISSNKELISFDNDKNVIKKIKTITEIRCQMIKVSL